MVELDGQRPAGQLYRQAQWQVVRWAGPVGQADIFEYRELPRDDECHSTHYYQSELDRPAPVGANLFSDAAARRWPPFLGPKRA